MFRPFVTVRNLLISVGVAALSFGPVLAQESDDKAVEDNDLIAAIKAAKLLLDVRYRFEWKDQEGFTENAYANTVRTRLGFETGEFHHFKALVEFENVFNIGEDRFNSTTNGLGAFPVIADPDATEINRAQITFTGIEKTPITIGRQRFNLNNHRFVGAVDWRQNQQTFDAVHVSSTLIDNLTFDYLYIDRVHRIFGDDHPLGEFDSSSHVIAAAYNAGSLGTIKGYGIILDFDNPPALSSKSFGVRYENIFTLDAEENVAVGVVAEYASQSDNAGSPLDYRESYLHGEGAMSVGPAKATLGYEKLSGDGVASFQTPLATLHKFQGFADAFLTTPAEGLQDFYATLAYQIKEAPFGTTLNLFATYHDFSSDVGSLDFGDELDAGATVKIDKNWMLQAKGALYNGGVDGPADRSLIWMSLRFQY